MTNMPSALVQTTDFELPTLSVIAKFYLPLTEYGVPYRYGICAMGNSSTGVRLPSLPAYANSH